MGPVELTGMNWLLPMYWSSTAEPWLPTDAAGGMVLLVLGSALTLQVINTARALPAVLTVVANVLPPPTSMRRTTTDWWW